MIYVIVIFHAISEKYENDFYEANRKIFNEVYI